MVTPPFMWSELEDRCCPICVDYVSIHPSEEWISGGDLKLWPQGLTWQHSVKLPRLDIWEKNTGKNSKQKCQHIFLGWCHVISLIWCTFGILWICSESTATLTLFLSCSFLQAPPCLIDAISSCIHRHLCEHLKKQVRSLSSAQFLQSINTWKVGCWGPVFCFLYISEYRNSSQNH